MDRESEVAVPGGMYCLVCDREYYLEPKVDGGIKFGVGHEMSHIIGTLLHTVPGDKILAAIVRFGVLRYPQVHPDVILEFVVTHSDAGIELMGQFLTSLRYDQTFVSITRNLKQRADMMKLLATIG